MKAFGESIEDLSYMKIKPMLMQDGNLCLKVERIEDGRSSLVVLDKKKTSELIRRLRVYLNG